MSRRGSGGRDVERRLLRLLHGDDNRTLTHLRQIHAHLLRHNLHHSNTLLSHFINVHTKLSTTSTSLHYATRVFQQSPFPNIFLFNAIIKAYSLSHQASFHSISVFSDLKSRGIRPDEYTFAPLLKACANIPNHFNLGLVVYKEVLALGFHRFEKVIIGLLELCVSSRRMNEAEMVFDKMSHRDVIVWNLMVRGFFNIGNVELGLRFFRLTDDKNIVSWNTVISCLLKCGRDQDALEMFREMRDQGFEPDEATVVTVFPICARLGEFDTGEWVHSYAETKGLFSKFISVGNAIVDFYCKCGETEIALGVFKSMPHKNVVSCNTMISGLAFNSEGDLGIKLFEEMRGEESGVSPNDSTFVGVLSCCVHAGFLQKGRDLFASMIVDHGIEPKLEHYGCMVDLLGRSGRVNEAYELIRTMHVKPNAALWGALLSACRNVGDMETAACAVKELIKFEPCNSGNYVLLSNIYAERGDWSGVEAVRMLMNDKRVDKTVGQSIVG